MALKDYKKDENGVLVFAGKTYVLKNKKDLDLKFKNIRKALISFVILSLFEGLLPFEGLIKDRYLTVMFAFEILFVLFIFRGYMTLSMNRLKLIEPKYKSTILSFPLCEIAIYGLNILGIIFAIKYILNNNYTLIYFIVYLFIKIDILITAYSFKRFVNKLEYEEEK